MIIFYNLQLFCLFLMSAKGSRFFIHRRQRSIAIARLCILSVCLSTHYNRRRRLMIMYTGSSKKKAIIFHNL